MNAVALTGRLGNDPEMTYSPSGTAITKFRLAVSRRVKPDSGQQDTDWLDVTCFGTVAENAAQYLDKGAHVAIEGRVQSRTWEKQDGGKGYAVEIVAHGVEFLESKREAEERRGSGE